MMQAIPSRRTSTRAISTSRERYAPKAKSRHAVHMTADCFYLTGLLLGGIGMENRRLRQLAPLDLSILKLWFNAGMQERGCTAQD
jgi:hypothetical protein